jgi:tryptophan synthase alpha chain
MSTARDTGRGTAGVLAAAAAQDRAAFIGYLPVGYPDVPGSLDAVRALVDGGADIIEIGMPYTDPGMDGPVIEAATVQALSGGVRVRDVFTAVQAAADAGATPVVMSYWNLILQYGVDAYTRDLASAGGAGIVTPDLIPDEADEWIAASDAHGLDRIFLVAPSSSPDRLATVAAASRGFVYARGGGVPGGGPRRGHAGRGCGARVRGSGRVDARAGGAGRPLRRRRHRGVRARPRPRRGRSRRGEPCCLPVRGGRA